MATTDNSEIRTTGKNSMSITKSNLISYFKECISDISVITKNIVRLQKIDRPGYGYAKARGKEVYERYKINYIFFVRHEDILYEDVDYIEFNINSVNQAKPTISMHVQIKTNKEKLKSIYEVN